VANARSFLDAGACAVSLGSALTEALSDPERRAGLSRLVGSH
jgi:2-keto-3-deoxy-6-phosphogluconate aldolase